MRILYQSLLSIVLMTGLFSCDKVVMFGEGAQQPQPTMGDATARLFWIGPDYKLAVHVAVSDAEGIRSVRLKNGEWQLDTLFNGGQEPQYVIQDTFLVAKDVNRTEHTIELVITNANNGVVKKYLDVEDLSAENLIPGYNPDLVPPSITLVQPTTTKYLGFSSTPVDLNVEADIADEAIDKVEVKVWGETADGHAVDITELIESEAIADKRQYHVLKPISLPGGKVGQYQYIVRATDASGNKKTVGGTVTVGYVDRLYLSDAANQSEVTDQGYDHFGACRGIGTIYSMKKQGANTFLIDYYYTGDANIRFVAFMGSAKPFNNTGGTQAGINYTLGGANVAALHQTVPGMITTNLDEAGFGLPSGEPGYYHITVDMTERRVTATRYHPVLPVDAKKYPGWSESHPWAYLSVTGSTVDGGGGGWTEAAGSPKLNRDAQNPYLFKGSFRTNGSSSNMSLSAPLAALGGDVWGHGWFRLVAARSAMVDDYGDLVTTVAAVGASTNGANWGFSTAPVGTWTASYDLILNRFRLVRTGP